MVSYAAYVELVEIIASNLCQAGIAAGDMVAVMLPKSVEHAALLMALGTVGACIIPLRMEPAKVAAHHLRGLNVCALVTSTGNELMPTQQLYLEALQQRPSGGANSLVIADDESLPLLMGQSSGTTGDPKRFLLSRHQVWLRINESRQLFDMQPGQAAYLELEMGFFQGALTVFTQFSSGATAVLASPRELEDYIHLLEEKQVITAFFMPQRLQRLLALAGEREQPLFSRLRPMLSSAPVPTRDKLLGRRYIAAGLMECYASNESGYITLDRPENSPFPGSVGKPVSGVRLEVVDEDHQPLAPGEPGQVRLQKSAGFLPTGYIDNPEATARHFRDGWYYPGDIATVNDQGYVFLQGRKDDVINRGGVKFYPLEIERVLLSHPAVQEAAVTSWPHPVFGQVPLAFVELSDPAAVGELRSLCEGELGPKAPDKIIVVREMPRNAARKIMKRVLREQYAALLERGAGKRP